MMKCDIGDWIFVQDELPKPYSAPIYVSCRAKDKSRKNWIVDNVVYGFYRGTSNPWGIPILDNDNYEVYAWMPMWYPNPAKERQNRRSELGGG